MLSIIIPTYNETDNIRSLVERLYYACRILKEFEIIIVDDESVGTARTLEIVIELQAENKPVRMHVRKKHEGRGLSSAVLLGFSMAKYDNLLCMDADLQHEPESVPDVASPVLNNKAEFSIGSRYCNGGKTGFDWSFHRKVISFVATLLAYPLSKSSDPMSGFFCTNKNVIARCNNINPIGFKVGLEIMARSKAYPVVEVPITFRERKAGESKLTMLENIYYIRQLFSLYVEIYQHSFVFCTLLLWVVVIYVLK